MELSSSIASSPSFSTARILLRPSSLPRKDVKLKAIFMPRKCFKNSLGGLISYQPNNNFGFPKAAPTVISYERKRIPLIKANADQNEAHTSDSPLRRVLKFLVVLLRFMAPRAIILAIAAFTGVMTRIWMENAHLTVLPKWIILLRAMSVLVVTILCQAGFISGINQIYDIEIDKINKPHYPLASGEMSMRCAWILVISFVVISVAISAVMKSCSLLAYVLGIVVLGSLYSVPPFSLKRSTVGAILVCGSGWCTLFLGLSAAARNVLGLSFGLSMPVIFITTFATIFSLVFGALKDIEDLEGDNEWNVPTLASIHGSRKVAFFCFGCILLTYAGSIAIAILMPQIFRQCVMVPIHIISASYIIFQAWKLEKANYTKEASKSVYQSIWNLSCLEFILFPFM